MSVVFPVRVADVPEGGEILAGGTDLGERVRSGSATGPFVDIGRIPGLRELEVGPSETVLGALVTVEEVGDHPEVRRRHPALASICRALATPQIRTRATMGGVLCQRTRCWYYRHPDFSCFKSGEDGCPAREGNALYGVAIDLGPCVHPHPSSVALGLIAYDGVVDTDRRRGLTPTDLFGDGSDPRRDHQLEPGELLTKVRMPRPGEVERGTGAFDGGTRGVSAGTRGVSAGTVEAGTVEAGTDGVAYVRAMSRAQAEWPLVECVARLRLEDGVITLARVALGGVANIPLRLAAVEEVLLGARAGPDAFEAGAALALQGTTVLPGGQDKRALIRGAVLEALEEAAASV